ncbi:hypothetical protein D3C71_1830370 [compost metagenome]
MRVAREAGDVVLGAIGAEFIQQQERVQVRQRGAADDPGQAHAGPVGGGHATDGALHAHRGWAAHRDSSKRKPANKMGAQRPATNRHARNRLFQRWRSRAVQAVAWPQRHAGRVATYDQSTSGKHLRLH